MGADRLVLAVRRADGTFGKTPEPPLDQDRFARLDDRKGGIVRRIGEGLRRWGSAMP